MNNKRKRPVPGLPVIPITQHDYWPCCRSGPDRVMRPIAGPHSPFCSGPALSMPLIFTLKVIEPGTCRVISATRIAGREEALAALRFLGHTNCQPVLVSKSTAEFLPRPA